MISIINRIYFIILILMVFCGNYDSLNKEKKFYNMAFDSLFENYLYLSEWSSFPDKDNIDSIYEYLYINTLIRDSLEKRSLRKAVRMARNKDEARKIGMGYYYAKDVFLGAMEFYIYPYLHEYNTIDSIINSCSSKNHLSQKQKVMIESLKVEQLKYEAITIKRFQTLDAYLYNKKDSLRSLGWNNYLEWRKTYNLR